MRLRLLPPNHPGTLKVRMLQVRLVRCMCIVGVYLIGGVEVGWMDAYPLHVLRVEGGWKVGKKQVAKCIPAPCAPCAHLGDCSSVVTGEDRRGWRELVDPAV